MGISGALDMRMEAEKNDLDHTHADTAGMVLVEDL